MKSGGKVKICVWLGVLLSASAVAASDMTSAGDPYGEIVERNVFNLHAPAPPPSAEDLLKRNPPPKLTLTGITTILGRKLAFLTLPPPKPGSPPDSIMLAEGQAQDEVEVQSIDEKGGVVKVSNHGQEETLDFEHNGAKSSAPPQGGQSPMSFPPPSLPPPNVMSLPRPGNVIRPIRTLTPRGSPFSNNNYNNNQGGSSVVGGGMMGGTAGAMNGQQAPLTREEQAALMEIQRVKYQDEGNGMDKLLPPSIFGGQGGGPPAPPAPQ